jgi:Lrp/AsnC family transcriptional regulator, regulator for asnA, asnC and gidA
MMHHGIGIHLESATRPTGARPASGAPELDDVDRQMMRLLRHDGRLGFAQMARTLGLAEPTVRKRVDRLLGSGAIDFGARINPAPIGFPVDAFVGVRVKRGHMLEVGRRLAGMAHVAYLACPAGGFDYLLQVFLPDTEGLFTFLTRDLKHIDGISSTETWHVLRTEKFFYNWEGESAGLDRPLGASLGASGGEADARTELAPMVRHGSLPHGELRLDDLDRRLMKLLRHDGRLSYAQMARTVALAEPTVRKRIDRLVEAGAILLGARIDPARIGFPVDAFVGIRVAEGHVLDVGRKLAAMEHVAYLAHVGGSLDIVIQAFLPSIEGLFRFITEDLEGVDEIDHIETWHVLRTQKFFYDWEGESVGLEHPVALPTVDADGDGGTGMTPMVRHGSLPQGELRLDDLDRQVMRLLRHDARLSYARIARAVGVAEPTVRKRVDRLLQAGAILLGARLDPTPLGFPVDTFIGVQVTKGHVIEVGRTLAEMEHVSYLAYLAGGFDIIVQAFLPSAEGLFKFLNHDLKQVEGISATETWHVLRTEKFFYDWEAESVGLDHALAPVRAGGNGTQGDPDSNVQACTARPPLLDGPPCADLKLDALDRRLMKLLRHDGRLGYVHAARIVGVSEPTVRKRVERLLRAGALVFGARINPAPIGLPVDAFVGVRVAKGRAPSVGRRLAEMEHVAYLAHLGGSLDYLVQAYLPDTEGLFRFLNEDLKHVDGITFTETWHVLRTEKFYYNWEGETVGLEPPVSSVTTSQQMDDVEP